MARRRPVVGITCYEEEAQWGDWERRAALLPVSYVRALERAGAIPVLIPPQPLTPEEAGQVVARFDGIVIAGGNDVDPSHYGATAHERTVVAGGERDALELATVKAAAESALPTLAICRGLQVLNVARGGTLIQHLPDVLGHDEHSPVPGGYGNHEVELEEGSQLASILSWRRAGVPAHHHQAIEVIGEGLRATAHTRDGIVEAVEDPSRPFLIGVQWHPEAGEDPAIFEAFVAAARRAARPEGD